MIDLPAAAKYVTAIGVIVGGGFAADERYASASTVSELQSELRVDRIFNLANESAESGGPDWLCQALEEELVALCTEVPEHYLCRAEVHIELKAKAGCG
jgi:hypothetical protein